jgi:hypothetical protein
MAGTLMPVCRRKGAIRASVPWIVALAICATAATAVQLSRRGAPSTWVQTAPAAPETTPAAQAAAAAAPAPAANPLARLKTITNVMELVNQPEVVEALRRVLGPDVDEFQRNLSVSGVPVLSGETITFTTCATQSCGVSEAAVSVATDTGTVIAALLANNHIRIYGAKSSKLEDCPEALQSWAQKLAQGHPGDFTYEMRGLDSAAPASRE